MAHLVRVGVVLCYYKTQLRVGENCGSPAGKLNSSRGGGVVNLFWRQRQRRGASLAYFVILNRLSHAFNRNLHYAISPDPYNTIFVI